jgi:RNA polymerase sigma-70 factor (ECF subfamily)
VASAAGRLDYDPRRGTFRGWLYTVTRNKLYSFLSARRRHPRGSGDPDAQRRLEQEAAPDTDGKQWDQEYERRLFHWAAEQVRGEFTAPTWQAFWRTAVEGNNPREVGAQLGLSPGAVYVARSRVLARLRQRIQELGDETAARIGEVD